jgi:hypothetical protein
MSSLLVIFVWGWCINFVGFESGQKQSVKLLQNMVYNTTQQPPPPHSHTRFVYTVHLPMEGGGGRSERRYSRGLRVHKYSSFVHGGNSSQAGSKIPTMSECLQSIKSVKHMPQSPLTGQFKKKPTHRVRCPYSSFVHDAQALLLSSYFVHPSPPSAGVYTGRRKNRVEPSSLYICMDQKYSKKNPALIFSSLELAPPPST